MQLEMVTAANEVSVFAPVLLERLSKVKKLQWTDVAQALSCTARLRVMPPPSVETLLTGVKERLPTPEEDEFSVYSKVKPTFDKLPRSDGSRPCSWPLGGC